MVERSGREADSTVTPDDSEDESPDGVFEVLASRERRFVLYEMSDRLAKYATLAMDDENARNEPGAL